MKYFLLLIVLSMFIAPDTVLAEMNPLLQSSSKYQNVVVVAVECVDTLVLESGERVRLIGIRGPNPPKVYQEERDSHGFVIPHYEPTTPFEDQAFRYVNDLVKGAKIRVEFDVVRRDDGVLLGYVFLADGKMLNLEILKNGFAQLRLAAPNMKYADLFRSAYKEARKEMRGIQGDW